MAVQLLIIRLKRDETTEHKVDIMLPRFSSVYEVSDQVHSMFVVNNLIIMSIVTVCNH